MPPMRTLKFGLPQRRPLVRVPWLDSASLRRWQATADWPGIGCQFLPLPPFCPRPTRFLLQTCRYLYMTHASNRSAIHGGHPRPQGARLQGAQLQGARLQGEGHLAGGLGPQGDRHGRGRNARPDGHPRGVRHQQAAEGRPHRRLPAHDHPDRGADRDPAGARCHGALVVVQHLLHPGSRRFRDRRCRRAGVRLEGHGRGRILVVHRPDRPRPGWLDAQHDPG